LGQSNTIETGAEGADAAEAPAAVNRRSLMGRLGARAAGAAVLGAAAAGALAASTQEAQAQAVTDGDILNFALNLEYLEAEFYLRAVTGQGLPPDLVTGSGTQGTVIGGTAPVPFRSTAIQQYAQRLAVDELSHTRFIRASLQGVGITPVARPTIDLSSAFTKLALSAGLIVPGQTFNPFADDVSFLLAAYSFTDVGTTAYAGAARLLTNPDFVEASAAILGTEGHHAGMTRTLLANIGAGQATTAISAARRTLSGANDDVGLIVPGQNYNIVNADVNALVFRRTPAQVLNIVYLGGASSGFGFFPNRVNGNIS